MSETAAAGDMLVAALDYAARGWCVLPLHDVTTGVCSCREQEACKTPGKHPRITKWQLAASTNPDLISGWWAGWPTANVGILTGRRSNLVVLDVDPRHGGDKQLQALIAEHEPLPDTVVAQTGGGGWHYYLRLPARGRARRQLRDRPGPRDQGRRNVRRRAALEDMSRPPHGFEEGKEPGTVDLAVRPDWLVKQRRAREKRRDAAARHSRRWVAQDDGVARPGRCVDAGSARKPRRPRSSPRTALTRAPRRPTPTRRSPTSSPTSTNATRPTRRSTSCAGAGRPATARQRPQGVPPLALHARPGPRARHLRDARGQPCSELRPDLARAARPRRLRQDGGAQRDARARRRVPRRHAHRGGAPERHTTQGQSQGASGGLLREIGRARDDRAQGLRLGPLDVERATLEGARSVARDLRRLLDSRRRCRRRPSSPLGGPCRAPRGRDNRARPAPRRDGPARRAVPPAPDHRRRLAQAGPQVARPPRPRTRDATRTHRSRRRPLHGPLASTSHRRSPRRTPADLSTWPTSSRALAHPSCATATDARSNSCPTARHPAGSSEPSHARSPAYASSASTSPKRGV